MGALVTYKCDGEGCESIKKEANHWWLVRAENGSARAAYFNARPMSEESVDERDLTMCSESCVSKALSRWMQGNK